MTIAIPLAGWPGRLLPRLDAVEAMTRLELDCSTLPPTERSRRKGHRNAARTTPGRGASDLHVKIPRTELKSFGRTAASSSPLARRTVRKRTGKENGEGGQYTCRLQMRATGPLAFTEYPRDGRALRTCWEVLSTPSGSASRVGHRALREHGRRGRLRRRGRLGSQP